jgi:membrane fusion protein (multidrug efflux system)
VEARVDAPVELIPGMFARITVTSESSDLGVVLPDRALLTRSSAEAMAFVVVDGCAVQRRVRTGIESGTCIQVLDGVRSGETVIVAGHEKLKDGDRVRTEKAEPSLPCPAGKTSGDSA